MLTLEKKDLGNNTKEYQITVAWDEIKKRYNDAFDIISKDLKLGGFRRGKVPKKLAEKHVKRDDVYRKLLELYIPTLYEELQKQESLRTIVTPKIELTSAKEGEDWKITVTVAEKPQIHLGNYKEKIRELKASMKGQDIWVPGKDVADENKKTFEQKKSDLLNKVLNLLITEVNVAISDLVIEQELNRRLTQLVDDIRQIGLTMENYLKSKNETMESIRQRLEREISEMYKIEFILEEIADVEKITVEKSDLEALSAQIKDEKQRKEMVSNAYLYASILRRQKTLDYLMGL